MWLHAGGGTPRGGSTAAANSPRATAALTAAGGYASQPPPRTPPLKFGALLAAKGVCVRGCAVLQSGGGGVLHAAHWASAAVTQHRGVPTGFGIAFTQDGMVYAIFFE